MNDSLKTFLISLVTAVAVQFLLAPYVLRLHGLVTESTNSPTAKADGGAAQPTTAADTKLAAPNLEGMLVDDARERWRAKGIEIIVEGERDGSGAEPGTIVVQRPAPGAELSSKEIRVTVARKSADVAVPDVVGKGVDEARKALEAAGFEVADPAHEASDKPANTILRMTPGAGETAKSGSIVRLVVSQTAAIEVPKFTGLYLGKAKKAITDSGLKVGRIKRVEHSELGQDYVLRQTPAPAEKVPPGTEIELVVVAPN
jgi:beta-lactam-binding protein with PASTA domain